MKNVSDVVTSTGNILTENAVECTFDSSGAGFLMSILSNMYSNAYLAVLREYSCNARDSHIEVGQVLPIEVTLPSALQPSLLIRDYGIGLSREGILNTFGTYLKSTKRDTNEQVGAFGIGSKAAFTLGHQFMVTGVKDGVKTVVLFALNGQNVGTMNVMSETPTQEGNGVLISLAVPEVERMQETAKTFFSTWDPGTVLVNGEQPVSVFDTGYSINDSVHIIPDREGVEVIMGAVGYPVSRDILRKVHRELSNEDSPATAIAYSLSSWSQNAVYIKVDIGDVDIAPSREALRDTTRTINAIKVAVEAIATDIVSKVESRVNDAKSWFEAVKAFEEAKENTQGFSVDLKHIQWNGKDLKDAQVDLPFLHWYKKSYRSTKSLLGTETRQALTVSLSRLEKIMVVTGAPASSVSRIAKRVMESEDVKFLIVSDEAKGKFDWFRFGGKHSQVRTITFDELRAKNKALLAVEKTDRPKNLPSYCTDTGRADREYRTPLSEIIDEGQDILLFDEYTPHQNTWMFEKALKGRSLVVLLPIQKEDALRRHVNGEVEIIDGLTEIRRIAQESVDSVTDEQKKVLFSRNWLDHFQSNGWDDAETLYGDRLDDILHEGFKETLAQAPAHRETFEAGKDSLSAVLVAAQMIGDTISTDDVSLPDVGDDFPLLPTSFSYYEDSKSKSLKVEHAIHYLNGLWLSE